MKFFKIALPLTLATSIVFTAGCSKSEPVQAAPAASSAQVETAPAVVQIGSVSDRPIEISIPNFSQTSADQLAQLGAQSLSNLALLDGVKSTGVSDQISSLQSSLNSDQAVDALTKLKQLSASAQSIPGAPLVIETTKQLVSAWALKQGFDTSTIAPVLAALQQKDYAALASRAAVLAAKGGLSAEQKQVVNGVLSNYGIEANVDQALDAVKGLFNR
jgi:hypothetical protein